MRRSLAILLGLVLALTLAPPAAQAAESTRRPPSGVFDLEGHGYGHGRGLSQWGAYGAAEAGLTYGEILSFYYPGTRRTTTPASMIRVQVSVDSDKDTWVDPAPGLALSSGSSTTVLPTGDAYDSWRIVRTNRGGTGSLQLQRRDSTKWYVHELPTAFATDATFTSSDGFVRLVLPNGNRQQMRGAVTAVSLPGGGVASVGVMSMEDYLRGVVPAEMPAGWTIEALQAQSVAARSYAARLREGSGTKLWHTCDTTACQVFKGTAQYRADGSLVASYEHPRTDRAIAATAGVVLRYTDSLGADRTVLTEFSASNGGWTAAGSSAHPYQVAKADPYDGRIVNSSHTWSTSVTAATFERAFPAVGSLSSITIDRRSGQGDLGGRVLQATLTGTGGSIQVTGDQIRFGLRLKSNWFAVSAADGGGYSRDWSGDGVGDVLARDAGARLLMYPGNGSGGFSAARQVGRGWSGMDLVTQVQDWSGDGRNDLVARQRSTGALWLYTGDGRGGFTGARAIGSRWGQVEKLLGVGDWDGDGSADLLVVLRNGEMWSYPGNGAGGFGTPRRVATGFDGSSLFTPVGDFSGDGLPDFVSRNASNDLVLHRGDGAGGLSPSVVIGRRWGGIDTLLGVGDWNRDGAPDILARTASAQMVLYRGNGFGGFVGSGQVGRGWGGLTVVG
jgi:SpoIID/LytB domain protein